MSASRRLESWCLAAGILLSVPLLFSPISNPDLPWHLSAGRFIVEHHALPRADFLSWTKLGQPWMDFEWAVQLLYYGLHVLGGAAALWLFKALVFGALLAAFAALLRLWGLPASWTGLSLLPLTLSLVPALDIRPENLSLLFALLQLLALEARRLGRLPMGEPAFLAAHAAAYALWANLHGGFAFGLALCFFYFAGETLQGRPPWPWLRIGAAGFFGTWLNPFGPMLYGVFWEHARMGPVYKYTLTEWREPTMFNIYQWPFWVLLIFTFTVFAWHALRRRGAPYAHLFVLAAFGLAAADYSRNTSFFCVLVFPLALRALHELKTPSWDRWRTPVVAALLALPAAFAYGRVAPSWLGRVEEGTFRVEGVCRFLEREAAALAPLPLYNPWGWGGYLGWRLHPAYRVFQDGRYLFHEFLPVVHEARATPESWQTFLASRGVDLAMVPNLPQWVPDREVKDPDKPDRLLLRPVDRFFMPTKTWALIYWDAQAMVFVRREKAPRDWLKTREYRALYPKDFQYLALAVRQGKVRLRDLEAEAGRHARDSGEAGQAAWIRRWLSGLREAGRR